MCVLTIRPGEKGHDSSDEDTSWRSDYLSRESLALLLKASLAGTTVLRPEAGFGPHHRLHTYEGGIYTGQPMLLKVVAGTDR